MTNFTLILAGVHAVLTSATDLIDATGKIKAAIARLFLAKVISAEEQDRLHAHCDAHMNARMRGEKPPELVIDPD